jgi:hypothetical protein
MLRAAIVVDDIASVTPWRVRGVEVRGRAEASGLPSPIATSAESELRLSERECPRVSSKRPCQRSAASGNFSGFSAVACLRNDLPVWRPLLA